MTTSIITGDRIFIARYLSKVFQDKHKKQTIYDYNR